MHHNLKLRIEYADAVLDGSKCFEIRENDRGFQKGDTVKYQTVDREGNHVPHPVEDQQYEITYVLPSFHVTDGWVVFGTRPHVPIPGGETEHLAGEKKPGGTYPLNIGDVIYHVWVDADHGCLWRVSESLVVSGIAYQGFFTSETIEEPMLAQDFWGWEELGVTAFRTRGEALRDAERRNREEKDDG